MFETTKILLRAGQTEQLIENGFGQCGDQESDGHSSWAPWAYVEKHTGSYRQLCECPWVAQPEPELEPHHIFLEKYFFICFVNMVYESSLMWKKM